MLFPAQPRIKSATAKFIDIELPKFRITVDQLEIYLDNLLLLLGHLTELNNSLRRLQSSLFNQSLEVV